MPIYGTDLGGKIMLLVKELSKKIDHKQILDNITLNIPKGSIYGIIGENGAGKTTLIRHLVGAYQGDTGFVELEGMRIYENPEAKAKLVYIPDEFFDTFGHNIRDIKELYQGIYPSFNEARYLRLMKMFKHDSLENFSKLIWDILIQDVSERNMTIFISSHHLNELDSMCDHIALINNGKIVFEEALDHLKEGYHKLQIVLECGDDMYALEKELKVLSHQMMGRVHTLIVAGEIEAINRTVEKYCPLINETLSLSLEEIFLFTLGGEYDELKEVMG